MADQHNANIPAVGNQISADVPDIKENLEWHKDLLQMIVGWKADTIASVGPPNHRAQFTHGDDDTLTIGAGSYFHDGTTRQTVFWDAAITFECFRPGTGGSNASNSAAGASEWHYIYLDDSAIVTQGDPELDADCFLNSTTAPSLSAAKHGWYNGSDRCIFAVLTDATSDILPFYHAGDVIFYDSAIQFVSDQDVDTSFVDVEAALTMPAFSRRAKVIAHPGSSTQQDELTWSWRVNGSSSATGHIFYINGDAATRNGVGNNSFDVITDSNHLIEIKASASDSDNIDMYCSAWYFPIGM